MAANRYSAYGLRLADGAYWNLRAEDPEANLFIEQLAEVMRLSSSNGRGRQLLVQVQNGEEAHKGNGSLVGAVETLFMEVLADYPWEEECHSLKQDITCSFKQEYDEQRDAVQLIQFSSIFALDAVTRGGMLLHGALIERDQIGVILAGPGGAGKSTACDRLPKTWHTLSDDTTMIVRDERGNYWAHPWPTWSRLVLEEDGGRWDVGKGVRIGAICFLSKSSEEKLIPLGEGEMVCLGMESIEQASGAMSRELDEERTRKLKNIYFRNICQLAKAVSAYQLSLNLENHFWKLIEETLVFIHP